MNETTHTRERSESSHRSLVMPTGYPKSSSLSFNKNHTFIYYMCMRVLPARVSVHHMHAWRPQRSEEASAAL